MDEEIPIGKRYRWGYRVCNAYEPDNTVYFEGTIREGGKISADSMWCRATFRDGALICDARLVDPSDLSRGFAWSVHDVELNRTRSGVHSGPKIGHVADAHWPAMLVECDYREEMDGEVVEPGTSREHVLEAMLEGLGLRSKDDPPIW